MEHLLQENIPRLLPSWHDLSLQDFMQIKSHKRFLQDKLPDFGGTGVGISNEKNGGKFYLTKHAADNVTFKAEVCSLPFFPPFKVSLESEPCLLALNKSKAELNKFCVTLDHLKRLAYITDGKFQKDILSSYKIGKKICSDRSKKKKIKFTVPDTIIELATKFPRSNNFPEANFDYLGGCLTSSQSLNESHILLHPVGNKLNKLGLTPLEETCSHKTFQPVPSGSRRVKMKKGCIQKIRSAFSGNCFVQQGKICQYVNFADLSNIKTEEIFRKQGKLINIEASPYNPSELISIDENGILELHDIDTWKTVWNSLDACSNTSGIAKLKACAFGSHPRSVLSLVENSVYVYDIRLSKKTRSDILLSKHFSSFPEEKYLNIKHLSVINPFQHLISTTNHVYICDERYHKVPVLIWSHVFKSSPLYCDVACYNPKDSDAVALLGSQESCELTLFTVNFPKSQIQPILLHTPMLLSSPSDCIDSLKLHGMHVNDDLTKRFMNPLIGVCAIPHSKKVGFTAFQLTSLGDVFYQDFESDSPDQKEHTYRIDTGCVLTPPERILPHLSKWTSFFSKHSIQTDSNRNNLVSINVGLKDFLSNSSDISSGCDLCNSNTKEFLTTSNCSSCGLNSIQVEKTLDAFSNLGLLAGPVIENGDLTTFDVSSLSDFTDEFSRGILKPWNDLRAVSSASPNHSEASHLSFDSTTSGTSHSNIIRNLNNEFNDLQCSDTVKSLQNSFHNVLSQDDTMSEYPFASQESTEEIVPPSQDIRPIIGETLKTPCKPKIQAKMNTSLAGF